MRTSLANLYSDVDGGPTRLADADSHAGADRSAAGADDVSQRIQPQEDPSPLAARMTLPFGAVAVAKLEHSRRPLRDRHLLSDPFFSEIRPKFPALDMTGALQVSLEAPATLYTENRPAASLDGSTVQLTNGHERSNMSLADYKSVLGFDVTAIFNGEFEPASGFRRVPVTRIDLSGYGASLFSDWRNSRTEVPGSRRFDMTRSLDARCTRWCRRSR